MKIMKNIQENCLLLLAENGGFQFTDTWFPYTSGWIGPYYVQSMDICKTAIGYQTAIKGLMDIAEHLINKSGLAIDVISGGESRDWPFSFPVAEKLGVATLMIYKDGKMLGADVNDKRVVHIADLNNEGSSPRDKWVPVIKNAGGTINDIIFLVDRLEDGVEEMKKLGLNSYAVVPLNEEAWIFLKENEIVTQTVFDSLMKYWKDRKAWGMKKIIEHPELLLNILNKDKTKGLKIFNTFYPLVGEDLPKALGFDSKQKFKEIYY